MVGFRAVLTVAGCLIAPSRPAAQATSDHLQTGQSSIVVQQDSNDPAVFHHLALAYLRSGRPELAWQALRTAVQIDPGYAPAFATFARLPPVHAARPASLPPAAMQPDRISDFAIPASLLWNEASAYWYGMLGLAAPGIGSPRSLLRLRDGSRMYPLPQAMWDDERWIQRAFFLDPLQELVVPDLPVYWHRTIGSALRAYHDGRFAAAFARCDTVILRGGQGGAGPTPAVALWYHALAAVQLGKWEAAIADIDRLQRDFVPEDREQSTPPDSAALFPRSEALEYALGRVYELAGRLDDAQTAYIRVTLADPLRAEAHAALARVLERRHQWDAAVDERQLAIERDSRNPNLIFELGRTLAAAGQQEAAAIELRRAIAANPRETRAYYALGLVEAQLGDTLASREALVTFVDVAPSRYFELTADARRRLGSK